MLPTFQRVPLNNQRVIVGFSRELLNGDIPQVPLVALPTLVWVCAPSWSNGIALPSHLTAKGCLRKSPLCYDSLARMRTA